MIIYFLVEGNDDERFIKKIITPYIKRKYEVKIIKYSRMRKEKIFNFIKSIKSTGDYFFLADLDRKKCVTEKKEGIKNRFKNIDQSKIIVVIKEIESWYLAGLSSKKRADFKIRYFPNTNEITKEKFNKIQPKIFQSRKDFMIELLKFYSIESAKNMNKSFNYFLKRLDNLDCSRRN